MLNSAKKPKGTSAAPSGMDSDGWINAGDIGNDLHEKLSQGLQRKFERIGQNIIPWRAFLCVDTLVPLIKSLYCNKLMRRVLRKSIW